MITKQIVLAFIFVSVSFAGQLFAETKANEMANYLPQKPRYELKLSLAEFSVLNSAARLGVSKYGGNADFALSLFQEKGDVVWLVKIDDPRLIEMWEYWMAEKTTELVNLLDFNSLDDAAKEAFRTVKSVNAKITQSRANPIWNTMTAKGQLTQQEDGRWFISSEEGKLEIRGNSALDLKALNEKSVIVTGFIKTAGQMEITNIIEKKKNTLDLFVMSHCPFAKKAEYAVINFLDKYQGGSKPVLDVHYIFQKRDLDGKTIFSSMHGEKEMQENLVQIVIRELYPDIYLKFLLARTNNECSWTELAVNLGLTQEAIDQITEIAETDRDKLIEAEYEYVAGTYPIVEGSPTYIWESERVGDIRMVELFKGLDFSGGTCAAEK